MRGLGTLLNVAAILAGASAGALLGDRLPQRLGEAVKRSLGGQAHFVEGFVLASLVACVGPLAVLAHQGGLTALAAVLQQVLTPAVVAAMTSVGGLLVIAIGLRLLGLARVRVANLLPAVPLAPVAAGLVAAIR